MIHRPNKDTLNRVSLVTVGITDTQLLPPDARRIAFTLFAGPTNRFTVIQGSAVALDSGHNFYPTGFPFTFSEDFCGDAVRQEWRAISAVALQIVCILEYLEGVTLHR